MTDNGDVLCVVIEAGRGEVQRRVAIDKIVAKTPPGSTALPFLDYFSVIRRVRGDPLIRTVGTSMLPPASLSPFRFLKAAAVGLRYLSEGTGFGELRRAGLPAR